MPFEFPSGDSVSLGRSPLGRADLGGHLEGRFYVDLIISSFYLGRLVYLMGWVGVFVVMPSSSSFNMCGGSEQNGNDMCAPCVAHDGRL